MQEDGRKRDAQLRPHSDDARAQRLKLALRENLKRRKLQARGRTGLPSSQNAEAASDNPDHGDDGE